MKLKELLSEADIAFKEPTQSSTESLKSGKQIQSKLSSLFPKNEFKFINRPGKDDIAIKISPNLNNDDLELIFNSAQLQTTKEKSYENLILSNQIILPLIVWSRIFRNINDDKFIIELKTKLEKILKQELQVTPKWIGKSKFYKIKPYWSAKIIPNNIRTVAFQIKNLTPKNEEDAELGNISKSFMILSKAEWKQILDLLSQNKNIHENIKDTIDNIIKKYIN